MRYRFVIPCRARSRTSPMWGRGIARSFRFSWVGYGSNRAISTWSRSQRSISPAARGGSGTSLRSCQGGVQINGWTHSEYLVLRLQQRVAAGDLSPDDVAFYYTEATSKGRKKVRKLTLDSEARFEQELSGGFFPQKLDEARKLARLQLKAPDMQVVVDANILASYYKETVLGLGTECSHPTNDLFARLGSEDVAFLDEKGMVEGEWRLKADPDWFDAWLAERMTVGDIVVTSVSTCTQLLRKLRIDHGFPATGRDKWYVCLARTRVEDTGERVAIITEDVDFFEPKAKGNSKTRAKFLAKGKGGVAKALRTHDVDPRTVAQHCC